MEFDENSHVFLIQKRNENHLFLTVNIGFLYNVSGMSFNISRYNLLIPKKSIDMMSH